ncbi:MAG: type II toxin-antitoxin system VapC family toxin [Cyanobacteriota bacterium]
MKYLLDTHVLIWLLNGDNVLSKNVLEIIKNPKLELFVSIISFWEVSIKRSLGKLDISYSTRDLINETKNSGIKIISVEPNHIFSLEELSLHHRDPFDRLIVAQSKAENMLLISKDEIFDKYITSRIW